MRAPSCLALLFVALPLSAAELREVRVWAGPESTRVVFDLDRQTAHHLNVLHGPDRIVIDLPGVHRGEGVVMPGEARGLLQRVRSGIQPDGLRVVLDLSSAVKPKSFVLPPNADYGYRLVVDLFDPNPPKDQVIEALAAIPKTVTVPEWQAPEVPDKKSIEPAMPKADKKTDKPIELVMDDPDSKVAGTDSAPLAPSKPSKPSKPTESSKPSKPSKAIASSPTTDRPIVIAIDAGHGGEDPGARGKRGVLEKDVALAMAAQLASRINKEPGYRAILTRDGDYYVSLRQRMAKARRAQADLFVSVHANSNRDRRVNGTAVYVLSERGADSEHNRWLAQKENESDLIGGVEIHDKDDTLASVLVDISQASAMEASLDAAARVLDSMGKVNRLLKTEVQQAAFVVLKAPDMPSMLVETAFISNEKEERQLSDPDFQNELVSGMLNGIKGYFDSYRPSTEQVAASEGQHKSTALAAP